MSKSGPERKIENPLIDRIEANGFQVYWLTNRRGRGWADLTVMFGERVVFIEVKRPGGKPSPNQLKEQKRQRANGRKYEIFDNEDDAMEFLLKWRDGQI